MANKIRKTVIGIVVLFSSCVSTHDLIVRRDLYKAKVDAINRKVVYYDSILTVCPQEEKNLYMVVRERISSSGTSYWYKYHDLNDKIFKRTADSLYKTIK